MAHLFRSHPALNKAIPIKITAGISNQKLRISIACKMSIMPKANRTKRNIVQVENTFLVINLFI
jgi:hypothetical protein